MFSAQIHSTGRLLRTEVKKPRLQILLWIACSIPHWHVFTSVKPTARLRDETEVNGEIWQARIKNIETEDYRNIRTGASLGVTNWTGTCVQFRCLLEEQNVSFTGLKELEWSRDVVVTAWCEGQGIGMVELWLRSMAGKHMHVLSDTSLCMGEMGIVQDKPCHVIWICDVCLVTGRRIRHRFHTHI